MEEQQNQTNTEEQRTNVDAQNNAPVNEIPQSTNPMPEAPKAENSDVEKNKMMAIVGYILPILFFVPLINDSSKNSPFAKFHANQQLLLLIAVVIVNIAGSVVPLLGGYLITPVGSIFLLVVAIMGIIGASKGEMKQLPVIGGFKII